MKRRTLLKVGFVVLATPPVLRLLSPVRSAGETPLETEAWSGRLIDAALGQVGVTIRYDGSYQALAYPGGDVPRDRGVCTDVIIRAYRDAFDHDLQKAIHEDMRRNFARYPKTWGLSSTDRNIDHRRVGNMRSYFSRHGKALAIDAFQPGDLVTQTVNETLPHIVLVSNHLNAAGTRPLVIHNIGRGTRHEDRLADFPITGRYRYAPPLG